MTICTVTEAFNDLAAGGMVIVVDDQQRENEGDLVMAAELVTPEAVNFMTQHGRGLVCAALEGERLDRLRLPLMVRENAAPHGTAFSISVDLAGPCRTGISAFDRAATLAALADPHRTHDDFVRPGHIFPLRARPGGVLTRAGHTEAALDLVRLTGMQPAGVLVEILDNDGHMARMPALRQFARTHALRILPIESLIAYRKRTATRTHKPRSSNNIRFAGALE